MDRVPSWAELRALMTEGSGAPEPTMTGAIESVPGQDPADGEIVFAELVDAGSQGVDAPPHLPGRIRVLARRDGALIRLDDPDGSPRIIVGDPYTWRFDVVRDRPTRVVTADDEYATDPTGLLQRRPADDFLGNDLTRPTGPARAVTFLDRPAWEIELAPPPHKPAPMQVVVDAETGLLLERRNDAFGWAVRWTELAWGEPIEADVFVWDGPFLDLEDLHEKLESEHEQDLARRRAWFLEHVTAEPLVVPVTLDVHVLHHDADGSFEAVLDDIHVQLARRPLGTPGPWELEWYAPGRRWVDDRWEWALLEDDDEPLSDQTIAALRHQLSGSPQTDVDAPVAVELSGAERELVLDALNQWGGPAYGTEEVAHGIGFASLSALYDGADRLYEAVHDRRPLSRRDWTRLLLATEISFASDVVGAAGEWGPVFGGDAVERGAARLRLLQATLRGADVIDRSLIGTDDTL